MKRHIRFWVFALLALTLVMPMVLRQPAQAAGSCAETYTVRRGDTLFRIGLRFGLEWTVLQALNAIPNPNLIFVGQQLCVRRGSNAGVATRASTEASQGNTITIVMSDFAFEPKTVTIPVGSSIVFTNESATNHTATADTMLFDTQVVAPHTSSKPIRFDTAGTFPFHCQFHGGPGGIGMSGIIIVK